MWQPRSDYLPEDKTEEFKRYPTVTSDMLRARRERPRRVKMLMRDFIEDSLYNPNYGYFTKQAVIFSPGKPFEFNRMRDEPDFYKLLGERYTSFEDKLDEKQLDETRQLWHTPTELFRPYYGETIARYLVTNYKLSLYPYHDLLIYEMGAGNGTLMLNILDYIRDTDPEVYARTKFKVIEVSDTLAHLQNKQLAHSLNAEGHLAKVEIINQSIFDWTTYVSSPCFFLALEVFDNFAHDCLRFDPTTEVPLQGSVLVDAHGDFFEFYTRALDPVAARFLRVRRAAATSPKHSSSSATRHLLGSSSGGVRRHLRSLLPLAPNLTHPEWIPTRLMQFFDVLNEYFPAHRLVTSDFRALPDAVEGVNAPVVQTRYRRRMVPVSTPLVSSAQVQQGYFDILFPTDFGMMEEMYRAITGKLTRVLTHEEFVKRWAYVEDTQTRNGENPLLSWYKNASVMITNPVTDSPDLTNLSIMSPTKKRGATKSKDGGRRSSAPAARRQPKQTTRKQGDLASRVTKKAGKAGRAGPTGRTVPNQQSTTVDSQHKQEILSKVRRLAPRVSHLDPSAKIKALSRLNMQIEEVLAQTTGSVAWAHLSERMKQSQQLVATGRAALESLEKESREITKSALCYVLDEGVGGPRDVVWLLRDAQSEIEECEGRLKESGLKLMNVEAEMKKFQPQIAGLRRNVEIEKVRVQELELELRAEKEERMKLENENEKLRQKLDLTMAESKKFEDVVKILQNFKDVRVINSKSSKETPPINFDLLGNCEGDYGQAHARSSTTLLIFLPSSK
ncbi:MAG: hypothetical protein Q9165_007234 [Trypethelium subeluteriae]